MFALALKKVVARFPIVIARLVNLLSSCIVIFGGPYYVTSTCRAHYFLTIVDDASRAVLVYLKRDKGETSLFLKNFVIYARTLFSKSVKFIHSDNGKEFISKPMRQFYSEKGIIHQTSCVDTPQQNAKLSKSVGIF